MPLPPPSPKWPRYGCRFCPKSYISRAQLNRHLDLYLTEFTRAYGIKRVKTTLIKCHPLQVIRALRCGSGRYKREHRARPIQWDDLTFTPHDENLDLAVKLNDVRELDAFQSRALVQASEWVVALGYLHSPRKVAVKPKDETASSSSDDDHAPSASPATAPVEKNSDRTLDANTRAKYGAVSRRLFSNLGSTKQLAEGSGSNVASSKDKMSINCVSSDKFELQTPPRKPAPTVSHVRKHVKLEPLFEDSDSELGSPVVKGAKGKAREVVRFADEDDSSAESPRSEPKQQQRGSKTAPIVIISDSSSDADTDGEDDDDDEGIEITRDNAIRTPLKPPPTPRTRGAHFCTPGDDMPVVLWLSVKGEPGLNLPVRLGTTLAMAVELLKRKLGDDVVAFEDESGVIVRDGEWEEMMECGGAATVDAVWRV